MKLYTRKEVANILERAKIEDFQIGLMLDSMKPIELPTDEEIDKEATYREPNNTRRAFFSGAKYVIEQIQKQK